MMTSHPFPVSAPPQFDSSLWDRFRQYLSSSAYVHDTLCEDGSLGSSSYYIVASEDTFSHPADQTLSDN